MREKQILAGANITTTIYMFLLEKHHNGAIIGPDSSPTFAKIIKKIIVCLIGLLSFYKIKSGVTTRFYKLLVVFNFYEIVFGIRYIFSILSLVSKG